MSSNVIVVKGLSKEYKIQHEIKNPYKTLSDSLVSKFVNIFNLTKKKKQSEMFQAINNIDLSIKKGEKVAVIGRNGAGKSTLLKLLSRITEPTHGEVRIKGRVASLLEVGTGFHPELTGRENIFLNGAVLGMTKKEIRAKFDDIVEFSGCQKFLDTPVKRYSSGMRVRLGFAVAAHLESEILIVDEVLAVGDAEFQKKCLGKMDEISKGQGRTILFVSHSMSAVRKLCDRGVVLDEGMIIHDGDIDEAIDIYQNESFRIEGDYNVITSSSGVTLKKVDVEIRGNNWHISLDMGVEGPAKPRCWLDFAIYSKKYDRIVHYSSKNESKYYDLDSSIIEIDLSGVNLNVDDYYMILHIENDDEIIYNADSIFVHSIDDKERYVHDKSIINFVCKINQVSKVVYGDK